MDVTPAPQRRRPDPDGVVRYKSLVGTRDRVACDGRLRLAGPPEVCAYPAIAIVSCGTSIAYCAVHLDGWSNSHGCATLAAIDATGLWRPTFEAWQPRGPRANDWRPEPFPFDW